MTVHNDYLKEVLDPFLQIRADPYESLIRWKERHRKRIIGCFPMHIPEEIIHAAGMLPVVMWESREPITLGSAHIAPYHCGIIRSVIDDAAKGKLDFLDGMVCYETCLQARHLDFIIKRTTHFDYWKRIILPGVVTSLASKPFMMENLRRWIEGLEGLTGRKIGFEKIRESIRLYNENRGLLKRLYGMRRENPGLFRVKDIVAAVHSSMLMPKEEHNRLLQGLLRELEKEKPVPMKGPRIILAGSLCEAPRNEILDLIEESGMVVSDDDMYVGSRYFANDAPEDGDPLEALTKRYLVRNPPCPTRVDSESDWSHYLLEMVTRNKAHGVISLMVKYCPPHLAYYPDVERKLRERGVRTMMIEMDHEPGSLEQVKTRLQAFSESLGVY